MQSNKRQRREEAVPVPVAVPPFVANEYTGWRCSREEAAVGVERVDASQMTPQSFFERYVSQRKPVVLTGVSEGLHEKWTDDYLHRTAGDACVRVEVRPSATSEFGAHSKHTTMRLDQFMDRLIAGEELLYLTTEATRFDAQGRLAVVSSPLTQLLADITLRPSLMGKLVPSAVNTWFGRSAHGSSSGLHHDWHDNLYSLLRGRKRFELYAPCESEKLYPHGCLVRIHPNGRICYEGSPSRADGADSRDTARVAALDVEVADQELAAAEAAVAAGEKGAKKRRRAAETALDKAMDASLGSDAIAPSGGDEDGDVSDEEAEGEDDGDDGSFCGKDDFEDSDDEASASADGLEDEGMDDSVVPPHFSRVDKTRLADFPLYADAVGTHADVQAGEMLYLPAGWWHEVTSWSEGSEGGLKSGTHLALNWWFAPPDTSSFDAPYSSDLWERDYAHWVRGVLPKLNGLT